ncbi:hypothetical protein [Belliella aquatica]|uniref:Uncharacterized protein n=1 Tax=Belliella aquatica TaxID=1323734 RepID=A0ABQ1MWM0_9BACT|nr:hypothetical protein [Belliella aquatica]MCH7406594.1 hypothetical protein [Belliella aquatica]GGC48227.1 hypothetical protein GCM10010993_28410 [Belliella aquatica]
MRNFMNKNQFLEAVRTDDHFEIKYEILSLFFYFNGDRFMLMEAIQYALDNSTFKFETHKPHENENQEMYSEEYFAQVSSNFTENCSKERLNLLFDVYNQVYKNKKSIRIDELYPSSNEFPYKGVAIAAGAILALFLLYKILS